MLTCGPKVRPEDRRMLHFEKHVFSLLEAQIRLVNYCCTLLYKSILDDDNENRHHHHHHLRRMEINHVIYAEEHGVIHSLSYAMLIFLSVVRCRKEIERFYRENEHFRELLNAIRHKYVSRNGCLSHDSSIVVALNQVVNVIFDRHERKKRQYLDQLPRQSCPPQFQNEESDENQPYRKLLASSNDTMSRLTI